MLIRVFISIPIKDKNALASVLEDVKEIQNVKPSPLSQTHITLRFIGDVDDSKVKKIVRSVADAVQDIDPFDITLTGAGCFPNAKRPSVLWIGARPEDILTTISDRISANLRSANIRFDDKPFKSHITVGRCKGPADPKKFLDSYSDKELCSFTCDEILIMRSELTPKGAIHTVLERVSL